MKNLKNVKNASLSKNEMKKIVGGGDITLPYQCPLCREVAPKPQTNCVNWSCL